MYEVKYIKEEAQDAELPLREDGQIRDFADDRDFGIAEDCQYLTHLTTVDTCSCQLLKSLGIACRHIFFLRSQQDIREQERMTPMLQLIGAKWHLRSATQLKEATLRLRAQGLASQQHIRHQVRNDVVPRSERFSHLMEELRGLAEMAADDMKTYGSLLAQIPQMADKLASGMRTRHGPSAASASEATRRDEPTTARPPSYVDAHTGNFSNSGHVCVLAPGG